MTSVFAADAVARLSGTVGVAAVTAGPGKLTSLCCVCLMLSLLQCNSAEAIVSLIAVTNECFSVVLTTWTSSLLDLLALLLLQHLMSVYFIYTCIYLSLIHI